MIYLDNAATTWPKPPAVVHAMQQAMEQFGANPGRGGHAEGRGRRPPAVRRGLGILMQIVAELLPVLLGHGPADGKAQHCPQHQQQAYQYQRRKPQGLGPYGKQLHLHTHLI